jgi:hypothetical protein
MTILAAITNIQILMRAVTGVKAAPNYPAPGIMPIVITHLSTGDITPGSPAGAVKELNNIAVEVHIPEGGGLADAFTTLEVLHPLITAALVADVTFSSAIQTYSNITFTTMRTNWDGVPTLARVYVLNNCKVII